MNISHVKQFIQILGFKLQDGENGVWYKEYSGHNNYKISIKIEETLNKSVINFGSKIKNDRKTTANFSQSENLVVLECVDRLLGKGYKPSSIFLEKNWQLGHKGKGYLDVQVLDDNDKSFLMIECKTWGKEYDNAKKLTEKDGGQLFSYLIQEKSTRYACLYASTMENDEIKYQSDIIVISKGIRSAENQQEAFEAWIPQIFETKGIFEPEDKPYKIEFKGILKKELRPLTEKDGGDIFYRFLEILRKNVVSDKTNSFNKIFNLFLCKIVDEFESSDDEPVEFQWKENEKNEDVMLRLNDLYKKGMDLYLGLKIEAVTEKELTDELQNLVNKSNIKNLFIRQKLYSGNEFAFKEVFDKKSFNANCIVVKEAVKLLEKYQIKYSTKQQFLGDFFENLLNTGIKQESGQYFTPIPIAQFICKSIPLKQIIEHKNEQKEPFFLPYVIDYASGSGHFLTEIMEEIDNHIKNFNEENIRCGEKYKKEFLIKKDNFLWAKEYIYGIEKDYRLAKTTKISTFLNGDGDAQIICGDGLGSFEKSKEYREKLKIVDKNKDNKQFDVVVANPPYSVDGFKTTIDDGKESFELFSKLTDRSSEIECLFIERTKQLLKNGGVAGIILPVSMLSIEGVQTKAREVLLRYFEIKAIVELGSNTFSDTNQKTSTLFLKRRVKDIHKEIELIVEKFIENNKDVSCNNISNVFTKYVEDIFEDLSFNDYIGLLNGKINKKILDNNIYQDYKERYKNLSDDEVIIKIRNIEKEKLIYFIISYKQRVVLVKAPDEKISEKDFLGYEFSKAKGRVGIKIYRNKFNNNELTTKLYNEDKLLDERKVNYYIQKNFANQLDEIKIDSSVEEYIKIEYLDNLLDFKSINFQKKIITTTKLKIKSKYKNEKLFKLYPVVDSGTNAPQDREFFKKGKYPFIRAGNISKKDENNFVIPDKNSLLNDLAVNECTLKKFKKGTLLFAKSGRSATTNKIARLKEDSYIVNHLACIYSDNILDLDFLYYYLEYYETSNLIPLDSDYPSISLTDIRNFPVPLVGSDKKDIVEKMNKLEKSNIKNIKEEKDKIMSKYFIKVK